MSEKRVNRWLFEDARTKMSSIQPLHLQNYGYFSYPPPISPSFSSPIISNFNKDSAPRPPPSSPSPSGSRISPAVLFIIVILAVLFFISGLLHLLVRFLIKHPSSSASSQSNRYPEISSSDALQRQLQQLFHLHDSGLDQAFIDALPVFHYKDIVGLKEPSDCAVCLYEFSDMDKLRLLPMCSHAFHLSCIDTWLLSNSTCPLCRGTLFTPGFPIENPIFEFDNLREEDEFSSIGEYAFPPSQKIVQNEEIAVDKGVFPVRLGKFKKLNVEEAVENREGEGEGETSSSRLDERRCFSMGSYQYVVGDSNLGVALNSDNKRPSNELELNNGRSALADMTGKKIGGVAKGESYSISKIWLWPNKGTSSGSADSQIGMPSSLNVDLPWMSQTRGTRNLKSYNQTNQGL